MVLILSHQACFSFYEALWLICFCFCFTLIFTFFFLMMRRMNGCFRNSSMNRNYFLLKFHCSSSWNCCSCRFLSYCSLKGCFCSCCPSSMILLVYYGKSAMSYCSYFSCRLNLTGRYGCSLMLTAVWCTGYLNYCCFGSPLLVSYNWWTAGCKFFASMSFRAVYMFWYWRRMQNY